MGGKRPRQSHGVSVLPDDAGVASVTERHTRGADDLRRSKMPCEVGASPASVVAGLLYDTGFGAGLRSHCVYRSSRRSP